MSPPGKFILPSSQRAARRLLRCHWQVIPHVTNEIKDRVYRAGREDHPDVVITEISGTVGDIESLPFLEAIRQIKSEVGRENVMYIHCTLIPYLNAAGEMKTKPTQHSVKELRSIGIQPQVIVCRSEQPLSQEMKNKIALFCDIEQEAVIEAVDVENLYECHSCCKSNISTTSSFATCNFRKGRRT